MILTREKFESLKELPFYKGKIVSGSMSPVIKIGEEVVVEVGAQDLKRFDIIVFYYDGKLICHYLWSMNSYFRPILLQTRNLWGGMDIPIEHDAYFGKVVSHRMSFYRKIRSLFL